MALPQFLKQFFKGTPPAVSMMSAIMTGRSGTFSFSGKGKSMKLPDAVKEGYGNLVWVYRCVREKGKAVGSVPWVAVRKDRKGEPQPVPGHALEMLMNRPNPYFTRQDYFEAWSVYLDLTGNSYWEIVFVQKKPYHLFMLRPDWVTPKPHPTDYLEGYEFDPGAGAAKKIMLEPNEVLHFKYLDPLNEYVGMSPMAAASRVIETENSAINWNKSIFDNMAVPGGVLHVPSQTLQNQQKTDIAKSLDEEFSRENLMRPMVLWGGMEWEQMALSPKDLDFAMLRKMNKYEICAVFGVPPQLVGANEDPTYSNYSVARLSFWEDQIITQLDWLKTKVNTTLAPYFNDGVEITYDLSAVPAMREAFGQKVKTAQTLWAMGWPINMINKRLVLGMDHVEWGDVAWMSSSMQPIADGEPLVNPAGALGDEGLPSNDPYNTDPIEDPNDPKNPKPPANTDPIDDNNPPDKKPKKPRKVVLPAPVEGEQ